jgi:hypothetical protein
MAYTKFYNPAHDDDPTTPANAAWANHVETGVFDAAADADAAQATADGAVTAAAAAQATADSRATLAFVIALGG